MLLLLAPSKDAHAQAIASALHRRGVPPEQIFQLDTTLAMEELLLQVDISGQGCLWRIQRRTEPSKIIDSAKVKRVYLRRYGLEEQSRKLTYPDSAMLDQAEVSAGLRKLIHSLPRALFPLDHPAAIESANNKLLQLMVARKIGFRVPETLFSNNPAVLSSFARRHRVVAVKPLSHGAINQQEEPGKQKLIWCKAVPGEALAGMVEARAHVQLYLQGSIAKVRDLRILVLPQRIFAVEIDTSSLPELNPDWRALTMTLPHRLIEVEPPFEKQMRAFLASMGLVTGSFDFAVTAEGERIFFECNPSGQWLWLETMTGAPIADAVAAALMA
jgi:hypothetical protein